MRIEKHNVAAFDTLADFKGWMTPYRCHNFHDSTAWHGGVNGMQAISMLATGDQTQVANAQKLLDRFDVHIDTHGQQMTYSVAGFAPCVPAYLGGSPESMYCMEEEENPLAPLKVMVDLTTSCGVNQDIIKRRGTVILAATMALAAMRPVSLEVVCVLDCAWEKFFDNHNFSAVRVGINSAPLDLGSACYALCHSGFARHLAYGAAQHLFGAPLQWASVPGVDMRATRDEATIRKTLELLGEDEATTLWVPAIHLYDELLTEPEAWIAKVLAKYGHAELA